MIYKIVLKGLMPGSEVWEQHAAFLNALPSDDIDGMILSHIYEWRSKAGYYKVKYMSKEVIQCDN